jgi:hypothetical protein
MKNLGVDGIKVNCVLDASQMHCYELCKSTYFKIFNIGS